MPALTPKRERPSPGVAPAVRTAAVWGHVVGDLRAGIDPFEPDAEFSEPLAGLHTREIAEPGVFSRYFHPRPDGSRGVEGIYSEGRL